MILLGTLTVGGKTFTAQDSTGKVTREQLKLDDNFYGGSVKSFYKTKEGFLICLDRRDNLLNIGYIEGQLTDEGLSLLNGIPVEKNTEYVDDDRDITIDQVDLMDRGDLIKFAKHLGIEGKLATLKTADLKDKIKENMKEGEKIEENTKEENTKEDAD